MASIMGESGDIFYPQLDEEKDMIPFDRIAIDLLHTLGYEPDICKSEEEAKEKAVLISQGKGDAGKYPIFFFGSDTSGEKSFEEFFTEEEQLDEETFIKLGVVKNSKKRNIAEIDEIFHQLATLFESGNITKKEIVDILKVYLPNFEHIETGKGLDSKM
jgi:FlaA1/EpsC-like NDP-sugar epimerase